MRPATEASGQAGVKDHPQAELVAEGLSFPTSLTFGDDGTAYIAESGLPWGGVPRGGRILRLEQDGRRTLLLGDLRPPVNGLTFHEGNLYIAEGGSPGEPGRLSRLSPDGDWEVILDNLPGPGNYHTNMVAVGPDGKLYFSQGAMTNTGIIGLDAYEIGWLKRLPHARDIPGYDVTLAGVNVETENPLEGNGARATTGAFRPFGTSSHAGQRVPAGLPCTAAVMRCNPDGSELELVAWGVRNAYGLGFLPDGRLIATDQGADDRGSRPVGNVPELLIEVRPGAWYGWPDYIGNEPITDPKFHPTRGPAPQFVLANHHEFPPPEAPLLHFPTHTSAVKFDVAPAHAPQFAGQLFIALFGDEAPMTAPPGPKAGRSVARVDPSDWSLHPFVEESLSRPIDVRFHPSGDALYVLDFGQFEMSEQGVNALAGSGKLWRVPLTAGSP
ncbi:PQQ-dependent sugar dehydrogenase [Deinococcus peraridilitoris]|uniref:Glucose/sorbosone dehydrogenase n=1 Tax=Deinococcus peraridilitoris (strain DSM 19664 / LMG 22246 / CIP 109416 / KR-200) TaxID=937777 RepID=L0A791_DEIPD|nr:glucose sorbosone dehydrogenase [Deinococcus peraridilitoris]AFZ69728.1 glucose/sorbosone dehydrogenase [Deinococcus peraridilitoris DSM 19664]